jgi:bla regulator protein BlaR1
MIQLRLDMPLWLMGFYGGAMVLAVLVLRTLLGRRLPKRVMPVLWALVLVRLLVPFSVSSPLTLPIPGFLEDWQWRLTGGGSSASVIVYQDEMGEVVLEADSAAGVETASENTLMPGGGETGFFHLPTWNFLYTMGEYLPWVWGLGAGAVALMLLWRYSRSRKGLRGLYPIEESPAVARTLERCRVQARVSTCDTAPGPMTVGVFRPWIILPASVDFEDEEFLDHILTHEAMHIRRRDNFLKLLMAAALCLHWYNPLVWLMARELCRDIETACDEAALKALGEEERQGYARSLVRTAVPGMSGGLFASAFSPSEVERRVKGVLAYRRPGRFALAVSLALVLLSATAFATSGQTFFDSELGSWCGAGNYIARASLNRPIYLGESRNYARSRTNAVVMEVLEAVEAGEEADEEALAEQIASGLSQVFQVEPSAFRVEISYVLSQEELEAEYAAYGLVPQGNGWSYRGQLVHLLEDPGAGVYNQWTQGEVDIYISRDDAHKITSVEPYLYFRF